MHAPTHVCKHASGRMHAAVVCAANQASKPCKHASQDPSPSTCAPLCWAGKQRHQGTTNLLPPTLEGTNIHPCTGTRDGMRRKRRSREPGLVFSSCDSPGTAVFGVVLYINRSRYENPGFLSSLQARRSRRSCPKIASFSIRYSISLGR